MSKKKTTIDDLAVMVQKGFEGVSERIDNLEKNLTEEIKRLDARMAEFELRIDSIEKRLFRIETKLFESDYDERLSRIEEAVFGKQKK